MATSGGKVRRLIRQRLIDGWMDANYATDDILMNGNSVMAVGSAASAHAQCLQTACMVLVLSGRAFTVRAYSIIIIIIIIIVSFIAHKT